MRKVCTYAKDFRVDPRDDPAVEPPHIFPPLANFYRRGLMHDEVCHVSRFRLGSHNLEVERGRYHHIPWQDRICTRCSADFLLSEAFLSRNRLAVDDELHAIFDCQAFDHLRPSIGFFPDPPSVRRFLSDDNIDAYRFVSRFMNIVDERVASTSPEAQQPVNL